MQRSYCLYPFIVLISFFLWFASESSAQSNPYKIKVLANPQKSQVTLRWAPTDPLVWQLGNKYGYTIERFTLSVKGKVEEQLAGRGKMLTAAPIQPAPIADWEQLISQDEKAEIVKELLFGTEFMTEASSPSALMKQKRELENRFGMALFMCDLSTKIAIAAGLMWVDPTVSANTRYVYRIRLAQQPEGLVVEPAVVIVNPEEVKKLPSPTQLTATFTDQAVRLRWPVFFHQGIYTAYAIEKSTDGKIFKPVSELPYVHTSESETPQDAYYIDSLADNQTTYYYRISGLSPFGEIGPPSALVSGTGKKDLAGMAVIEQYKLNADHSVTIHWSFPETYYPYIQGYYLTRASKPNGNYQPVHSKILPVSQTQYTDRPIATNTYYRLQVIGKDGKAQTESFPFLVQTEDTIAPAIPTGLTGKVDSMGVVRLTWKANTDVDLQGYRLFRANSLQEEFVERTQYLLNKPAFTDTINVMTLTRDIYYYVIAVDKHYNPSLPSPALPLKRPDKIAPIAPLFIQASLKSDSIWLRWELSSSADVARYELYRQTKTDTLIQKKATYYWKSQQTIHPGFTGFYADKGLKQGQLYRYLLQAVDSAGNAAFSISPEIWYETGIRPAVSQIKALANRQEKKIILDWKYDTGATSSVKNKNKPSPQVTSSVQGQIIKSIVYRAKNDSPLQIYQTLEGSPEHFEDTDLTINTTYRYRIKLFFSQGVQTQISELIQVVY